MTHLDLFVELLFEGPAFLLEQHVADLLRQVDQLLPLLSQLVHLLHLTAGQAQLKLPVGVGRKGQVNWEGK